MLRSRFLTTALLVGLVSGCGTEDGSGGPGTSADSEAPFSLNESGEVELSCGGSSGWPPSVMKNGLPGVLSDDEATAIFADILSDPEYGEEASLSLFPDGVDVEWRVLRDDGDQLLLGLGDWTDAGPAGERVDYLGLERDGDTWRPGGWGDCRLSPVLKPGYNWVQVTGYRGDPTSSTITARVSERECTSGRDPEPFLHEPYVVETDQSVTLYWTSEPAEGAQNCIGNPTVARDVQLQRPLGDRNVYDGFDYPPRRLQASARS